ncbi:MAG: hypothetical protein CMB99_12480 [Flavobacteriaceae bacterium]|nr:hypothetical protein [Flavobacteriaceae bacterium]|tara:strand:+ start:44321 stop:45532 length:1212 start_codon:yes stop_codon:yes gene_type:complete
MRKLILFTLGLFLYSSFSYSQGSTEYTGGYKIKFNEEGTKYMRIIAWGQFWAQHNDNVGPTTEKLSFSVRRARVLTFTQLNKKFLILTHFGLNSLNGNNTSPIGTGDRSQLFFHDFWGEWKVSDNLNVGAGLHYWNGISRLTNQSTLNMMTLDNNRQSWANLGLSDQFARHIGVYAKGKVGRLQYRLALNEAGTGTLDTRDPVANNTTVYGGRRLLGSRDAGKVFQGYFDFNFLDQESNFLPYKVGTYLGSKEVFNVGAGFFSHPNGAVNAAGQGEDVNIFAVDAFYDAPVGGDNAAITAYLVYQSNDYGTNYNFGPYATGNMIYSHVGYLFSGDNANMRFQPYLSYQHRTIDAINDNASRLGIGANIYQTGHHSKLSFEYTNSKVGQASSTGVFTLQAMIYL